MKPTHLHDPLRDIAPAASPFASLDARLLLLAALALLLLGLLFRLARTAPVHPERAARADMTRLLAVVWGGLLVEWIRSRQPMVSPGFWLASAALLPFVIGAFLLSARLFRAYKQPAPGTPGGPR